MTKRFRLGLFLALAAAVGLHLRPCLWCLVADDVETVASGFASEAPTEALPGPGGESDLAESAQEGPGRRSGAFAMAVSSTLRRPSIRAMASPPVRMGYAGRSTSTVLPASFQAAGFLTSKGAR